jgi:anti-sigma-K factor RskA
MTTADRHRGVEELLAAYALGVADEDEVRQVEAHLAECEVCREELVHWRRSTEALAASAEPMEPSAGVRERLMAEVGGAPAPSAERAPAEAAGRRRAPLRLAAVIAVAALALAALGWGISSRSALRDEVDALEAQVAELETRLAQADTELARSRGELRSAKAVLALLAGSSPNRDVLLAGLEAAPNSQGRLIVDPDNRRAVFLAGQLPPLEPGRVYQLWSLKDGQPASAGVFETVADGTAIHVVENVPAETPDAWAVTIEPEGGVPSPTGPMVLVG